MVPCVLRPKATRTPGIVRALSRANAATIRAAIRTAPISVISSVYQTSRTRLRIWVITAATRPGGGDTGAAASSVTGPHRTLNSRSAAWQ